MAMQADQENDAPATASAPNTTTCTYVQTYARVCVMHQRTGILGSVGVDPLKRKPQTAEQNTKARHCPIYVPETNLQTIFGADPAQQNSTVYVEHIQACYAHSLICSQLRETKLYRKCWGPLDNTSASAVIRRHLTNNVSICNPEHIEARGRNDEATETLA